MLMRILRLLRTVDDRMLFAMRLVLGSVMFAHGAQKAMGWFGGPGLRPTLDFFGQTLGIPAPLAVLAIAAEFLGGAGLILGLLGRVGALGIAINMIVAAVIVHLPNGFFMNWFGAKQGEGIEYHLLALALASLIVVRGSGAWSLDQLLFSRLQHFMDGRGRRVDGGTALAPDTSRPVPGVPAMMQASWTWVTMAFERRWSRMLRLPWNKRPKLSPDEIGARCPDCGCELPVSFEQRLLLADNQPCWLFCPLCVRLVAGKAFARKSGEVNVQSAAPATETARSGRRLHLQTIDQPA